jgi:hypothetical protein
MVGLLALIIIAMLLLLLTSLPEDRGDEEHAGEKTKRDRRVAASARGPLRRWSRRLGAGTLIAITAMALIWAEDVTSRPSTCLRCHEIARSVVNWQDTGGHHGANCLDCHGSGGAAGWLETRVNGLANVARHMATNLAALEPPEKPPPPTVDTSLPPFSAETSMSAASSDSSPTVKPVQEFAPTSAETSQTTGSPDSSATANPEGQGGPKTGEAGITSSIDDRKCLECHPKVASGTMKTARISVRHSDFLVLGVNCGSCHPEVGHQQWTGEEPRNVSMMGRCLPCHDDVKAPSSCSTCHLTDIGQVNIPERYPKVRIPERSDCEGCHSTEQCTACHRAKMPHPTGFADPQQHAPLAAFDKKEDVCLRCHPIRYCASCHEVRPEGTPQNNWGHTQDWETTHQTGRAERCALCHTGAGENMCGLCHSERRGVGT